MQVGASSATSSCSSCSANGVGRSGAGLARPRAASARTQRHVEMMFAFIMVLDFRGRIVFGLKSAGFEAQDIDDGNELYLSRNCEGPCRAGGNFDTVIYDLQS